MKGEVEVEGEIGVEGERFEAGGDGGVVERFSVGSEQSAHSLQIIQRGYALEDMMFSEEKEREGENKGEQGTRRRFRLFLVDQRGNALEVVYFTLMTRETESS